MAACAAAAPPVLLPFVIKLKTSPSRRSILFCMSSGVPPLEALLLVPFLFVGGAAYVHDALSPRFMQLSHGFCRLHLSLRCLHGPHDSGILFRLRITL